MIGELLLWMGKYEIPTLAGMKPRRQKSPIKL